MSAGSTVWFLSYGNQRLLSVHRAVK